MGTITPRIVGYKVQLLINRIYNKFQNSKCLLRNSFEWKRFVALLRSFKKCRKYGSCVLLTPAIECRSILAIDTLIDPQLTLDRPSIDPRLAHGRHLRRQTFNFRWHSMEWRSILAMTTHWMSVDVSIATLRSAVGRMSVVCQWCIGSLSVMYSSQYPSSPVGTPLYGLYRYVRPQRVWFFSPLGHKLGIDFSHFGHT